MYSFEKEEENCQFAIKLLNWNTVGEDEVLCEDGLEIKSDNKSLLPYTRKSTSIRKKNKDKYDLFSPSRKQEHLQFLIDKLLGDEEVINLEVKEINDEFRATIKINELIKFISKGYETSTEALFYCIESYYGILKGR